MTATRIGKGITYIAILNAFQFAIGIIFYYVVSKILTPTEIGIMSTLNFAHATFIVLAPLGLQFAAVKYVAEHLAQGESEKASAVARTMIKMVLVASVGFLILFVVFAFSFIQKWAEMDKIETLYVVISVAATFGAMRNAYLALLQGLQLFDKYAVANLASMGLSKLLGIIFVLLGQRLFGVVTGILLGEIGGLSLTFFFYRGHLPSTKEKAEQRALLNFSLPIFGMMLLTTFQDWSDRMLFLVVSRDLEALGLFELVIRASASLGIIGAIVDVIMFPTFSDAFAKGGKRHIGSMMGVALRYLGFMYFPAAVGMATISKTAMTILYQARTAEAGYLPLTLISIFTILGTFATIL
ncbi:MAG: oligosaccharide flippase family protein, partial [Candidatus Bathyarchaeia archaeon]